MLDQENNQSKSTHKQGENSKNMLLNESTNQV